MSRQTLTALICYGLPGILTLGFFLASLASFEAKMKAFDAQQRAEVRGAHQ